MTTAAKEEDRKRKGQQVKKTARSKSLEDSSRQSSINRLICLILDIE